MPDAVAVPLRVAVVGLGTVGRAVAAAVPLLGDLRLVAGVDIDSKKINAAASQFGAGLHWTTDADALDAIDIAFVCTGPNFDRVAPTLRQLMRKKTHVISDCAEMAWPWLRHPHLADVIGGEARKAGVVLLGTGVSPGVVSAMLPLTLVPTVVGVNRIRVERTINAGDCRPSVVRRAGLTLTPAKFRTLAKERQVGIAGVAEGVVLLAQGMGRHPTRAEILGDVVRLVGANGDAGGVRQNASYSGHGIEISIDVTLSATPVRAIDRVRIDGNRTVEIDLPGGVSDAATAAVMVNTARHVGALGVGLKTVLDLMA